LGFAIDLAYRPYNKQSSTTVLTVICVVDVPGIHCWVHYSVCCK